MLTRRVRRWPARVRERRAEAEAAVFASLDRLEAEEVARRLVEVEEGGSAAEARFPSPSPQQEADMIASLVRASRKDTGGFLRVVGAWAERRTRALPEDRLPDRAFDEVQVRMLTSVSNLFWDEMRPGVPAFRPELAAEGRRRGWRR